ncbi:IS110 family transposase [Hydrogenophaga sp.]|jgi:transposase|uniref:IS110 family transposase n=1 Tax=Hydrogenophaga sp. TaxID=1904254 RepID=UPI0027353A2E|nr:IS110 family transposase [Hydrogenophaga sp.]MDP3884318.1 IS110 family transposase [Hydrogenophaga sp.]MDZ4360593.1 IS110 family transposase [Variovorax sp.]
MNATTYGVDIAKNVFQLHWVDVHTGEIHRKKLARGKVAEFFAQRERGRVAMEACGGAHHWARVLCRLGHQVELLPPHKVRALVSGNKDDAADARAIWAAATQKDIRRVSIKTAQQQAELSAHRVRSHWVSFRTATLNALRGLLYEFGLIAPKGRKVLLRWIAEHRAGMEAQLPPLMVQLLDDQLQALAQLQQHIDAAESQIEQAQQANETARRLRQVPGIGVLGATALAATLGDGSGWKNAREFACCLGLVPGHKGTGGKVRMGSISKRGDSYIRTLLIHGARNLVRRSESSDWIAQMLKRRPFNVVATAVAHKLARTAWAMVAHGRAYQDNWRCVPPGHATVTT